MWYVSQRVSSSGMTDRKVLKSFAVASLNQTAESVKKNVAFFLHKIAGMVTGERQ